MTQLNAIFRRMPEPVLSRASSLEVIGLHEIAWPLSTIREVVELLSSMSVAVLGGDVYEVHGNTFTPTYENWFCERLPDESIEEFGSRSRNVAMQFAEQIAKYHESEPVVSLVLSAEPDAGE